MWENALEVGPVTGIFERFGQRDAPEVDWLADDVLEERQLVEVDEALVNLLDCWSFSAS